MAYEMTAEMEEAVITLIDSRITVTTAQQTRRIDRLENALVQLADAQRRSEERQDQTLETQRHISHQLYTLTNAVNNLTNVVHTMQQTQVAMQKDISTMQENQRVMQADIGTMKGDISTIQENQRTMQENQRVMRGDIGTLRKDMRRIDNRMAKLAGDSLEERYLKHAAAYLGRVLRKAKALKPYVMEEQFRAKLSEADYEDLLLVDLLVRGIPKGHKGIHVWLAFEISVVADRRDVERAIRRTEILHRADFTGIPAIAGESLTQGAEELAAAQKVVVVTNGKIDHWNEALARALAAKRADKTP